MDYKEILYEVDNRVEWAMLNCRSTEDAKEGPQYSTMQQAVRVMVVTSALSETSALRPFPPGKYLLDGVGEGFRLHGFHQQGINPQCCRLPGVNKTTIARA